MTDARNVPDSTREYRPDATSPTLVEGRKRGDAGAWERLARLYGPLVYAWCRADVYSLRCTFDFLLTGRPPFAEAGQTSRSGKMKAHALLPLKQPRPDVPDALAVLVERMLAKAPATAGRWPSSPATSARRTPPASRSS